MFLLTSQLKCHLVSREAVSLPLVLPWNYLGSCDSPRVAHSAKSQCRRVSNLHTSAVIRLSQMTTIFTGMIPFKVLHNLLPSHFQHSFNEDLIHVYANAASDKNSSVTQGTASNRETVYRWGVQEIKEGLGILLSGTAYTSRWSRYTCFWL